MRAERVLLLVKPGAPDACRRRRGGKPQAPATAPLASAATLGAHGPGRRLDCPSRRRLEVQLRGRLAGHRSWSCGRSGWRRRGATAAPGVCGGVGDDGGQVHVGRQVRGVEARELCELCLLRLWDALAQAIEGRQHGHHAVVALTADGLLREPELNVLGALVPRVEALEVAQVESRAQDGYALGKEVGAVEAEGVHGCADTRLAHEQDRCAGRLGDVGVVDSHDGADRRESDAVDNDHPAAGSQRVDPRGDPLEPLRAATLLPGQEGPREALVEDKRGVLPRDVLDTLQRAPLCEEVRGLALRGGLDVRDVLCLEPGLAHGR
mmetsp:Transcript_34418/g.109282  ORF Transcript_34418/g.109282 Transcript_34418/m.109282 type:complete len:322 (+) Transcript_34418:255-1220(+)